uniref:WAP domain-containing protein n=1 Tax=Heterorhabditis bacteriophora TaxID=37862 RepID=A0A1I7XG41_HETBA
MPEHYCPFSDVVMIAECANPRLSHLSPACLDDAFSTETHEIVNTRRGTGIDEAKNKSVGGQTGWLDVFIDKSTKMISSLIATLLIPVAVSDKLSWCEYWYQRGIIRTECTRPSQMHWSLASRATREENIMLSMPICDLVTDWGKCQRADHCPLGLLCWVKGNPCCTPQNPNTAIGQSSNQCPAPIEIGIQCHAKNPVNWCHVDVDCHRMSSIQKCCPTGCGYNMCVKISHPFDIFSRVSALSVIPSQCPPMDMLPTQCSATHGVSWCYKDSDCYSNSAQQRRCCPTRNSPAQYSARSPVESSLDLLIARINHLRRNNGCCELLPSPFLAREAGDWAEHITLTGKFVTKHMAKMNIWMGLEISPYIADIWQDEAEEFCTTNYLRMKTIHNIGAGRAYSDWKQTYVVVVVYD